MYIWLVAWYNKQMDEYDDALELLKVNTEAFGVATVKVDDGQMFMFSREFILNLAKKIDGTEKDKVIIFVQSYKPPTRESLS